MASSGPPMKKVCVARNFNAAKVVRFEAPKDIVAVINNFSENKDVLSYKSTLEQLQKGDIESETCATWFRQLEENIVVLNNLQLEAKTKLVNTIVKSGWVWKCKDDVVRRYCSLLECLLSFNANYTSLVVESGVGHFVSKSKEDGVVDIGVASEDENRLFNYVHQLLREVVKIVPMAGQVLIQVLKEKFPFEACDRHVQACYVINLLKVTEYMPEFRRRILGMIIARVKTLDLECPWDEIQDAERVSICESIPEDADMSLLLKMKHKQANLLDVLMKIMFTYIRANCHSDSVIDGAKTKKLYKELLTEFDHQMIVVSGTCHLQFLMFYTCSHHLKLCLGYIDYLWKQVINTKLSNSARLSAACYIGSFTVRHMTIPVSTVKDCLNLMKDWVHDYIEKYRAVPGEQWEVHEPFYAVCQAMFYMITCRVEELMKMPDGPHFMSTLYLTSIVASPLCPLRFCSANLARLFASKVKEYQLAYCYPFMMVDEDEPPTPPLSLKLFFPFDPYLLTRSSEFIEPIYRVFIEQYFYEHPAVHDDAVSDDDMRDDIFDDNSTQDSLNSFVLD